MSDAGHAVHKGRQDVLAVRLEACELNPFGCTLAGPMQVMLFMKGNKMFPQCGFSNTAVQVLRANDVKFETFDVLSDPDIRQVTTLSAMCCPCSTRV